MNDEALQRLRDYLRQAMPETPPVTAARRFSGGQSNPTYLLSAGETRFVLRAKPGGAILPSAHAIDREYRLLKALAGTPVPVARPLHYCTETAVIGAEFYVMAFVDGEVHWDPALPEVERLRRAPITDAMIETLAALHGIDWRAAGLADFGKPGDYAARQLARWSKQFRATQDGSFPEMERLIAQLEAALPPEDGRATLVHGDYRIDNLMYRKGGTQVVAVLDWELATIGHPFADLAYVLMHHELANAGVFKGLGGIDRAAAGLPDRDALIALYRERAGLPEVPDLDFWISLSAFRLAAILEGVRDRIEKGNASDPERGRQLVKAIPDLIRLGLDPSRKP